MKRLTILVVAAVVAVSAIALIGVGYAFAQAPWSQAAGYRMMGTAFDRALAQGTPAPEDGYGYGFGPGMMGGRGGMMGGRGGMMGGDYAAMQAMHTWMTETGGMHTAMWASLAEAVGLTPEALQAEIDGGKTLLEVAEAQGLDADELAAAFEAAHTAGLEAAVAAGALTQEQADQMAAAMAGRYGWMIERMGSAAGYGPGMMGGAGGFGPGNCPHAQAAP